MIRKRKNKKGQEELRMKGICRINMRWICLLILLSFIPGAEAVGKKEKMWLEEGLVLIMLLNVASMLTEGRRNKILKYLERKRVDVAILTEINLATENMKEFKARGWNWVAEVPVTNNRSGVLIMTRKENRMINEMHPENIALQGRLITTEIIMRKGRKSKIKVWAYYAPADRRDRNEFLSQLEEFMAREYQQEDFNIIAGDSNLTICPQDKTGRTGNTETTKQGYKMKEIMAIRNVKEVFRNFKKDAPTELEWTHEATRTIDNRKIKIQTRIDHFWTNDINQIYDIKMDMDFDLSDHRPMFMALLKREEGEKNKEGSTEEGRRKKHLVNPDNPEEIQNFKTCLESSTRSLSNEARELTKRKDRDALLKINGAEITGITEEFTEGIFQAAAKSFKNRTRYTFQNYEEAKRPGTPLMVLRMAHKMLKKRVEDAVNLARGTAPDPARTIWIMNKEWKEPRYKKMKEKFKFGEKYGPAWNELKREIQGRERITLEDIGNETLLKWTNLMRGLRNRAKNLYKGLRKEIKRNIAKHNNITTQELERRVSRDIET
eukprot:TRINITY_DN15774_c0_g1_i1.p1 TRINITY_DN15774_c0_g1~~TRINITY_DN15774_c0_g1_i1.p1  ORF type:complete len:549 (+),score=111.87 TRINITY_DN15774_c0_g1_i1:140-1786(+)